MACGCGAPCYFSLVATRHRGETSSKRNMRENQHDSMFMLELGQQTWGTVQLPILTYLNQKYQTIYTILQLVNLGQKYSKYIVKQCERIGSCSSCIFVIPCPHVSLVSPPLVQGALDSQHASLSESQMRKCQPGSKTSNTSATYSGNLTTGEIIRTY